MITDVLVANPQSAKSDKIMNTVDERSNPLTDDQMADIGQGRFITGAKESLESKHTAYLFARDLSKSKIIRSFKTDTLCESPSDSIINILNYQPVLSDEYRKAFEYFAKGDSLNFILNKYSSLIIFALAFWLLPFSCVIAQDFQYFNSRLDLNGLDEIDRSYNIITKDDGYVIAGNSIVYGETIYWWEKILAKIDFTGQVESIKHIEEDSVEYFFSYTPDYLIKVESSYYAVGIRREPSSDWVHQEGTLMQLDENLDTMWMKRFGENLSPFDTAFSFTSIIKINNNALIIAGGWKPQGLPTQVYLIKTDFMGNKIWAQSFSYINFYIEGYSVAQTDDSGFIIGCFKQTPGDPSTVDPVIIKTDSMGIEEWTKNLGGPYKDFTPMVAKSDAGNIIVGTSYADSMLTPDVPMSRINIIKLNNSGTIIWNKKFGQSKPNNLLRKIRILDDGSIIAVGATNKYDPEPDRIGWIFKTSAQGDSIWYREYVHLSGYESRNYLYDVIPTSDNGLIACGYVDPYPPDTGSTDTWVIKLDSIGCEFAGCDTTVGIKDDDKNVRLYDVDKSNLDIWPNPASGIVDCRLPIVDLRGDWTLMIYDIFGRTAPIPGPFRQLAEKGEVRWSFDVSGLPTGIYFISILQDGRRVKGGKFMVSR
ncbi:MAG TPA: hypothetical protein PLW31_11865 [Bacteroidales bacterium]|nr:hypothetical protein [Bacteroidales bacterium]HPI85731.1 hypothetical protein [Bacteroidales bacterium]